MKTCKFFFSNSKYFLFVIFLFFFSCKDNGIEPIDNQDIWPLKPGNVWFYKVEQPVWIQDTLKMEITGSMDIFYEEKKYTVMKMSFYGVNEMQPEYQWLYWKGPEGIYMMGGISPTDTFIVKELELKYPADEGDSWLYRSVAYSFDRREFYISDTLALSLVRKNVSVQIPAGNYKCYQFRFSKKPADDVLDIWDYNYYYSPGQGLIMEETISQLEGTIKDKFVLVLR